MKFYTELVYLFIVVHSCHIFTSHLNVRFLQTVLIYWICYTSRQGREISAGHVISAFLYCFESIVPGYCLNQNKIVLAYHTTVCFVLNHSFIYPEGVLKTPVIASKISINPQEQFGGGGGFRLLKVGLNKLNCYHLENKSEHLMNCMTIVYETRLIQDYYGP